jgi:surfactin family lipopeptide synthetase A/fengycin family lipopeptide synthetase D
LAFIDCAGPLGRIRQDAREFTLETEKNYIKEFFTGSPIEAKLEKISDIDHIWPFVVDFLHSSNVHAEALKNYLKGYENAIPDYQNLSVGELIQFLNMDRTFKNAGAGYIPPGKIRTPIHFFKAGQSGGTYKQYWNEYCAEPVIYHEVEGDHHSIFKQPDVIEFVRLFNEILKEKQT